MRGGRGDGVCAVSGCAQRLDEVHEAPALFAEEIAVRGARCQASLAALCCAVLVPRAQIVINGYILLQSTAGPETKPSNRLWILNRPMQSTVLWQRPGTRDWVLFYRRSHPGVQLPLAGVLGPGASGKRVVLIRTPPRSPGQPCRAGLLRFTCPNVHQLFWR